MLGNDSTVLQLGLEGVANEHQSKWYAKRLDLMEALITSNQITAAALGLEIVTKSDSLKPSREMSQSTVYLNKGPGRLSAHYSQRSIDPSSFQTLTIAFFWVFWVAFSEARAFFFLAFPKPLPSGHWLEVTQKLDWLIPINCYFPDYIIPAVSELGTHSLARLGFRLTLTENITTE